MPRLITHILAGAFFLSAAATAHTEPTLTITGSVKKPLSLTIDDLKRFEQSSVRVNEVSSDKNYHGVFIYRGVPLRTLLAMARAEKEESNFPKSIDLAIKVRSRDGMQTVLSWGEVCYRNDEDTIIAWAAEPVMPIKSCTGCHKPGAFENRLDRLKRSVKLPRLVVSGDFYSDRCLEDIIAVEVVTPRPFVDGVKDKKPESSKITLVDLNKKESSLSIPGTLSVVELPAKQVGDGKGYHGLRMYGGVSFSEVLKRSGIKADASSFFLLSAPDGYRSILSWGELILSPRGRDILLADTLDGAKFADKDGYAIIMPNDLSADRWVKGVSRIEMFSIASRPMLYIIGIGCGDTSLISLEALSYIAKSDAVVCTDDIKSRFAAYIGDRPVLYDPLMSMAHYYRMKHPGISVEESKKAVDEIRKKHLALIKEQLVAGKSVAFLEYGDPTIYGSWTYWLYENFKKEETRVIPGISAFNAANAMIARNVAERGSVIITVPDGIVKNEDMVNAIARNGDTMAIFIGLKELPAILPVLKKYYKDSAPVGIAYKAGYAASGRLVRTTLKELKNVVENEKEQFLGVIYIGECIK